MLYNRHYLKDVYNIQDDKSDSVRPATTMNAGAYVPPNARGERNTGRELIFRVSQIKFMTNFLKKG